MTRSTPLLKHERLRANKFDCHPELKESLRTDEYFLPLDWVATTIYCTFNKIRSHES